VQKYKLTQPMMYFIIATVKKPIPIILGGKLHDEFRKFVLRGVRAFSKHRGISQNERSECTERTIWEFCKILSIDQQKLYGMVRDFIKWHEKRDWQVCFQFTDKNNKMILSYLQS